MNALPVILEWGTLDALPGKFFARIVLGEEGPAQLVIMSRPYDSLQEAMDSCNRFVDAMRNLGMEILEGPTVTPN